MADKYEHLSDEDKKILEEHHRKSKNPENPEHPSHPKHHEFLKGLVQRFGNAAVFGAGATAGSDVINGLFK